MRYRAVIKQAGDWWIGWLLDLPGVNAQERTRKQVIESKSFWRDKRVTVTGDGFVVEKLRERVATDIFVPTSGW